MKKFHKILLIMTSALLFSTAAYADDYAIPFEQLPSVSQSFVNTHFAGVKIAFCQRDSHSYEVRLANATEIEFDYAGNWEDVDCKYNAVPESVVKLIPASIPTYVQTSFPSTLITKVKVKAWGYEIELNTGLELEFDKAGVFMRFDD